MLVVVACAAPAAAQAPDLLHTAPPPPPSSVAPSEGPAPTSSPEPTPTAGPSWRGDPTAAAGPTSRADPATAPSPAVLVGAGDIASCGLSGDEATAKLLDGIAGTVFTAGDNAYESGTATEFADCYQPTWGRHRSRTRPAVGNHEYVTPNASAYFAYFGAAAGDPRLGYYSYDLGAWHVIVLNSNCGIVGCASGSAQERWLRADLASHAAGCALAYWHHALFSSGQHGGDAAVRPLWQALYDAGADVVVVGHDHDYERFAPQDALGRLDTSRGIREFVVGTGGASLRPVRGRALNSEVVRTGSWGVLKLTLSPGGYDWQFISTGGSLMDSGSSGCH